MGDRTLESAPWVGPVGRKIIGQRWAGRRIENETSRLGVFSCGGGVDAVIDEAE